MHYGSSSGRKLSIHRPENRGIGIGIGLRVVCKLTMSERPSRSQRVEQQRRARGQERRGEEKISKEGRQKEGGQIEKAIIYRESVRQSFVRSVISGRTNRAARLFPRGNHIHESVTMLVNCKYC